MKGYPYSGWDSNLPVINTIAGMLDIGVSWDDYKEFKSDGSAPPSSDWIIYGKQVDQTEYSMTFVPKSAPNDAKSGDNYSLTAADDSGTCGVLYNSGPANGPKITTPTIKVFVKDADGRLIFQVPRDSSGSLSFTDRIFLKVLALPHSIPA